MHRPQCWATRFLSFLLGLVAPLPADATKTRLGELPWFGKIYSKPQVTLVLQTKLHGVRSIKSLQLQMDLNYHKLKLLFGASEALIIHGLNSINSIKTLFRSKLPWSRTKAMMNHRTLEFWYPEQKVVKCAGAKKKDTTFWKPTFGGSLRVSVWFCEWNKGLAELDGMFFFGLQPSCN